MLNILEQVLPIWGIGLFFGLLYLLLTWLSAKFDRRDQHTSINKGKKSKKVKKSFLLTTSN